MYVLRTTREVDTAVIPIMLKKKLRHRKVQALAQGHREVVQLRSAAASACGGLGQWYTWWNPSLEGGGRGGGQSLIQSTGAKACGAPAVRQASF